MIPKHHLVIAFTVALLLGALPSQPCQAQVSRLFSEDLTMHETTTASGMPMGAQAKPSTSTSWFSGNAMRRTSSDGDDSIIRFDQGKIIQINHQKKTYTEMTFEQLQQILDKAAGDSGVENKQAMEAMKQVMGDTMGKVTVTAKGAGENIAGYATQKYLVTMSPMEMEIWTAPDLVLPVAYYDVMKLRMKQNPMFDMGKMLDEFKKIKGMTVKSVNSFKMMGMNMSTVTEVTSVEKGPIPASKFDVPAGYKSVPMDLRKM